MKTNILLFFATCVILSACDDKQGPVLAPETIFEEPGLHVITSFSNKKSGTISTLYGNELALNAAMSNGKNHIPGEVFKLVTWDLNANPHWFGGEINGAIRAVETVKVMPLKNNSISVNYEIEKNNRTVLEKYISDKEERINFIFDQKASVFP